VLDSGDFVCCSAGDIIQKCSVETFEEYKNRKDWPENSFYVTSFYDWFTQKVVDKPNSEVILSFRRKIMDKARLETGTGTHQIDNF
jgi:hypothetical protein